MEPIKLKANHALALLLFLVLLASIGCTGVQRRDGKEEGVEGWRTGTRGLDMRFARNLPPARLYDSDRDFDVVVDVYNRGVTEIRGGGNKIYISGFDPDIITGVWGVDDVWGGASKTRAPSVAIEGLEGRNQFNLEGDFDTVEFNGEITNLANKGIDIYDPTILITACYAYETQAAPTVCIDPDPYSIAVTDRVCIPTDVSGGSQGAPVAVTRVDVEPRKGTTVFRIYVQNVGAGTVFKQGYEALDKCSPYHPEGLKEEVDYVYLKEVKVGNTKLVDCKPLDSQGNIRIPDGYGFIVCSLSGLSGPAYTTPLRVWLEYGYRDSISRRIDIISVE